MLSKESIHSSFLIFRNRIHIAETAARTIIHQIWMARGIEDRRLRLEDSIARIHLRRSNISNPRTGIRPCWVEDGPIWAETACAVRFWVVANSGIATGKEERDTLEAEFEEFVALAFLVGDGYAGFLATVGDGEDVGRFEDAALQLVRVAVFAWVRVFGIDAWSVTTFAVSTIGAV